MILLQWQGTLRFGTWARAAFRSQWLFFVVWGVLGLAVGLWLGWLGAAVLAVAVTVGVWLFPVVLVLVSIAQLLHRLHRVHGPGELRQWYTVTPDALEIALGQDRVSIPAAELLVVGHGPDWVVAHRRGMGRHKVFLYADERAVVPEVLALLSDQRAAA